MTMIETGDKLLAENISTAFKQKLHWVYDEFDCWNVKFQYDIRIVHAWISKRPHYCDRGHYQLNCDIIKHFDKDTDNEYFLPDLDPQDGFPRYFMEFETAKKECELFLIWRLLKQ